MRKKNFQTKALAVMMSAVMAAGSFLYRCRQRE